MDNDAIWKELRGQITCFYHDDCRHCMNFDNDTCICKLSGAFVIDIDNYASCPDFKCGVPFEYCCGDCDR